jgi:hypothetical protein
MVSRTLITDKNYPSKRRIMSLPYLSNKFLNEFTKKISPEFTIRDKSEPNFLMKVVGAFVSLFNKDFNTRYITVIGGTMWVPKGYLARVPDVSLVELLAHETMHERDRKALGTVLFSFLYLTPQILAVFSLLSLLAIWFSPYWLLCLLFLLCAAPLPSFARMYFELRGYRTNVFFMRYVDGIKDEALQPALEYIVRQFTGPYYFFMWPFRKHIAKLLLDRSCEKEKYFVDLKEWLDQNNLLKKDSDSV